MRLALACAAITACSSKPSWVTPKVQEVRSRIMVPCEAGYGSYRAWFCRQDGNPVEATIFFDPEEKPEPVTVTSIHLTVADDTADAALARFHTLLDGFIPPAHFEGMRTRLAGPGAETYGNAKSVSIDKVDVMTSIWSLSEKPPRFNVEVSYR